MKNTEFIALLVAHANKTTHIRAYSGKWHISANRIPDEITTKIGYILTLIQNKITQRQLIKPEQGLLIYNFESLFFENASTHFYSLNMLIKPLSELNDTTKDMGKPLQLVINEKTAEILNTTKYLLDAGYLTPDEVAAEELEPPISYGNYGKYSPLCKFIAMRHYQPIDNINNIFEEKYHHRSYTKH